MPRITISYRRADTDVIVGRIRDRLADHYGEESIFVDIDNVPFGKDFRTYITDAVARSDILIVVVGRRWLGIVKGGQARIHDETDFVRLEVETALHKSVPVIPVLIGPARMPKPDQLPEPLRGFAFINAAPVDTGRDFHQHMERLIRGIDQMLTERINSQAVSLSQSQTGDVAPAPTGAPGVASMEQGAIFISYTHEDQAAARRLRDFLEVEAGIAAWIDTGRLEAGDDWDHKIRRNIKNCSYFMPLISSAATRRPEGYFRREWALAVERAMDFADSTPFIIPVVIDDTPGQADGVPERFRRAQWTHLPGGAGNEEFRRRMIALVRDYRRRALD